MKRTSQLFTSMMPEIESDAESINLSVADRLEEVAQILDAQRANVFRVGAYRRAAAMLRGLNRPIDEIARLGKPSRHWRDSCPLHSSASDHGTVANA